MKLCPSHQIIFKTLDGAGVVPSRAIAERLGKTVQEVQPYMWHFRRRIAREGYVLRARVRQGYWLEREKSDGSLLLQDQSALHP
jgi:hypothetical protein